MYTTCPLPCPARDLHDRIYAGEILHLAGLAPLRDLIGLTRAMLEGAFSPHHPTEIHRHLSHERQIERFDSLGLEFSRSPEVQRLWAAAWAEAGLDPGGLARDRLVLRFQPHQDPIAGAPRARPTATIAFHRDTWGSNVYAQVNWWAPVYPLAPDRTFALFPSLWDRPLRNTSAAFDLAAVLERSRTGGRTAVGADETIPHLEEPIDPDLGVPVVIEPGSCLAFSGAHAHAGVPNSSGLTRISLETRTVWIEDARGGRGAPNVDGRAWWMALGWFQRVSDGARLHEILGRGYLEPYAPPDAATAPPTASPRA